MDKTIQYYDNNAEAFVENTVNANMTDLYDFFYKYVKPGSHILDLGCGSGRDSKWFIDNGYTVIAIDGSKELCEKASKYIGQPVRQLMFQELDYENEFDGVWACSSLLHLKMEELPQVFEKIYRSLNKNGILYCSFKYGTFSGERNERYFSDLTEETIKKIIQSIDGLEIVETKITSDVRVGREDEKWLNVIIKKYD